MKFSTSVNIERDSGSQIHYIPTPNAKRVVEQIFNDYKVGIHSFNIIGSYGTGKSSLILAFDSDLRNKTSFLIDSSSNFSLHTEFEFLNIVGDYSLLSDCVFNKIGLPKYEGEGLIEAFDAYYKEISRQNKFLVIAIDEFGKILEFAAKNNPEQALYSIQKFVEYVNDSKKDILLLTTLHQGFGAYAGGLTQIQRNEWLKVKGRFKEIVFNEPIEQLLFLAADGINSEIASVSKSCNDLYELSVSSKFLDAKLFPAEFAQKLYPLDVFAAKILTLAIQSYGQNERSLFSFLISSSFTQIQADTDVIYDLSKVYDYIINNFHSLISETHAKSVSWTAIQVALERVNGNFDDSEIDHASKIIKTIGLLNIYSSNSCTLDLNFFQRYCSIALEISNADKVLDRLEKLRIIRFAKYKSQYILFDGTDVDIEKELLHAGSIVKKSNDCIVDLKKYINLNIVAARAYYYKTGTPRYFKYKITNTPIQLTPTGEIDGYINLLFSSDLTIEEIQEFSEKNEDAVLFGYYTNMSDIIDQIFEINKLQYVLDRVIIDMEDKVARREIKRALNYEVEILNNIVLDSLFSIDSTVKWFFQGELLDITDRTVFNQTLSKISDRIYTSTPIFKNELVNKHKVSGAISSARISYLQSLIENYDQKDLGFLKDKFPPEKSIYFSLLKNTGIHQIVGNIYTLRRPTDPSFTPLWNLCEVFLEKAKGKKGYIKDLIALLRDKPFKLKQGFIEFWVPTFLIIKKEDYALYSGETYIPTINREVLDLLQKKPEDFVIKTFSVDGVRLDLFNKYREAVNLKSENRIQEDSFLETIKPFLIFYNKSLNEYARNTNKLGIKSKNFRDVLATAIDPEQTFFEDLPNVLGFNEVDLVNNEDYLSDFVNSLQSSIRELRACYDELINRIENKVLHSLGIGEREFQVYKTIIEDKFKGVKDYLLTPRHRAFLSRVMTPLKDRNAWINSITYPILNKSLEMLRDEEEEILLQGISHSFIELSNFIDLQENVDLSSQSKVLKIDISSMGVGTQSKQVILPKSKIDASIALKKRIIELLSDDENLNIYTLVQIINTKMDL